MLVRPAIVLLLLMRLGRPANIQEIASLLDLHEQTTSRCLSQLTAMNLADRPGLTPHAVRTWEMFLKRDKGEHYKPGLLIFVLENDEAPPPIQNNGHLLDCTCDECKLRKYIYCPNWYPNRCHCGCIYEHYGHDSEVEKEDKKWEEEVSAVEANRGEVDYW